MGVEKARFAAFDVQDVGGKSTALRERKRAPTALCLSDYDCFSWSWVSSADLHVVETTFNRFFESYLRSQFFYASHLQSSIFLPLFFPLPAPLPAKIQEWVLCCPLEWRKVRHSPDASLTRRNDVAPRGDSRRNRDTGSALGPGGVGSPLAVPERVPGEPRVYPLSAVPYQTNATYAACIWAGYSSPVVGEVYWTTANAVPTREAHPARFACHCPTSAGRRISPTIFSVWRSRLPSSCLLDCFLRTAGSCCGGVAPRDCFRGAPTVDGNADRGLANPRRRFQRTATVKSC